MATLAAPVLRRRSLDSHNHLARINATGVVVTGMDLSYLWLRILFRLVAVAQLVAAAGSLVATSIDLAF